MNIEDLTKTQFLLLTILVNFVTSIATGVLTVSLLDQAPPTVIQTVNRIVDHTIETVTTEVPVIRNVPAQSPSTEELLTSAIAKESARHVRIFRAGADVPSGFGVYVPGSRAVLTSGSFPGTVRAEFANGTSFEMEEVSTEGAARQYGFAADATLPSAPSGRLIPAAELKPGQTVIALTAEGNAVTGIISRVADVIYTDLPGIPQGSAAVNISGDIIGISLGDGRFIPGNALSALLAP
jgi:hypothetical protein